MSHQKANQAQKVEAARKASAAGVTKLPLPAGGPDYPILQLQQTIGNQAVQRLLRSGAIQAKLKISQPGDKYEEEADRVAEQVMRMPEPQMQRRVEEDDEELVQTKPLAETITPLIQREPVNTDEMEEEKEALQAKLEPGQAPTVSSQVSANINALQGRGQPLPEATRQFFEPRFGRAFSQVRVHTDSQAVETARSINAKAFTIGRDIAFGSGQYVPGNVEGKKLLAHELAHVLQQVDGRLQRKSAYQSQLENTFEMGEYIDKQDMCNVTVLAMQMIELIGSQEEAKRAATELLIENGFPKESEALKTHTLADLIMERFYQIKLTEWKQMLETTFPERNEDGKFWKRIIEQKKGEKAGRSSPFSWFQMGLPLIAVGLEILEKAKIIGVYEIVPGKDKLTDAKDHYETNMLPKLETGASIMLGTGLTGAGHYVLLKEVVAGDDGGIIVNDPYGMRLHHYIKNGSKFRPRLLKESSKQHEKLLKRLKYNMELIDELNKLKPGDNFPQNLGELNFYTWGEVTKYNIGKSATMLESAIVF